MAERRVAHLEPQHGVPASISDPTPALMAVNGPYWEEGLDFEGVPPSEPMRRCLENRHPISLHVPPHYRRHIIENNVLMLFGMINYYDHFWDDPNFLYIVAIDLEWDPDVCAAIVARYEKARNQFLTKPQRSNLSPHASNIAARIRLLVDNWRLREVRQWPMTTNRMRFIDSTRLHWRSIMEDDPESLVLHSPSLPYIHPVKCDWMHPVQAALSSRIATEDRQRSRSPPPCILRGNLRRSRTPPAPRSDAFLSRYQARHLRLLNREKTRAAVAKEKSSNRDSRGNTASPFLGENGHRT